MMPKPPEAATRQRAGVRGRRGLALLGGADLEHDHRLLPPARHVQRLDQAAGIAARFHAAQDDAGFVVLRERGNAVGHVHVGFVAGGDEAADAQAAIGHGAHREAADVARLRDDARLPRRRHALFECDGEGADQLVHHIDGAQAVGAQQPHAVAAHHADQFGLQGRAFGAGLGKAGRQHDHAADTAPGTVPHGLQCSLRGNGHDGHVRRRGRLQDRGIGLQALDGPALGVDGIDGAGIAVLAQQLDGAAADLRDVVGGTDHGDAVGLEECVQPFARGCLNLGRHVLNAP